MKLQGCLGIGGLEETLKQARIGWRTTVFVEKDVCLRGLLKNKYTDMVTFPG